MSQLAVRVSDELVRLIDELVDRGRFTTKAELVRIAITELVERERRCVIGEAMADGYRRIPQTDEELEAATVAAIRSIHEEPCWSDRGRCCEW
ncbi:MAG: ribbon-helix-helix domain-containing protein [Egibacteraceae bacterium]